MYSKITGEEPYSTPMRIYPAPHYTMGGLWVDYDLQSTIPGMYVLGEANFSDHGANRLGASALMQGLADGYFVLPATISNWLAGKLGKQPVPTDAPEFRAAEDRVRQRTAQLVGSNGKRTVDSIHKELGRVMWDYCGMARNAEGLRKAIGEIQQLRRDFWSDVRVSGQGEELNQELEKAGRVADFLEFAELMCNDALVREESCGGHFRLEHQTEEGEARRDDENFSHVTAWETNGDPNDHSGELDMVERREPLEHDYVQPTQRSYK